MSNADKGFTLVSLLAVITIMGIAMATIAPTWRFLVIRDREEELIFRGEQYQIAISLYQKKFNTFFSMVRRKVYKLNGSLGDLKAP